VKRALALLTLLVLVGCAGDQSSQQPKDVQPFASRDPATFLRDGLILTGVKARLTADNPDSTTTLGVTVNNGTVTLRGTVRNAREKAQALADARGVRGVKAVDDQLQIDPNGPRLKERFSDLSLATRITTALGAQIGLNHVRVRVRDGVATLEGSAGDEKTKSTAVATARGTSGIRNVVDRIRVEHP
jgi:osmotically-inducible protein OsmY